MGPDTVCSHRPHLVVHGLDGLVLGLPARRWSGAMTPEHAFARRIRFGLLCTCALLLTACSEDSFDPQSQIAPNPNLPEPQQYLFPPMHLASVVGWKANEK